MEHLKTTEVLKQKKKLGLVLLIKAETLNGVTEHRFEITSIIFTVKHIEGIICGPAELWKVSQIVLVYFICMDLI